MSIVAPTGILAGTQNVNTQFSTFKIGLYGSSFPLSETEKLAMIERYAETRMGVADEFFNMSISDISTYFNRVKETIDRYN